ncbi:MAG: biotin transporter BioY [Thermoplasmata archaeon]
MDACGFAEAYRRRRLQALEWRNSLGVEHRLLLSLGFALLTALAAQVRVYTPLTPVPFTLQVMTVLMAGALLGRYYGGVSMLIYLALGAFGLPVFAGWRGGAEVIAGATGGYLIGFVLAAFAIGWIVDGTAWGRSSSGILLAMLAGVLLIYLTAFFSLVFALGWPPPQAFALGIAPFIGVDIAKALAAAGVSRAVLPGVGKASG